MKVSREKAVKIEEALKKSLHRREEEIKLLKVKVENESHKNASIIKKVEAKFAEKERLSNENKELAKQNASLLKTNEVLKSEVKVTRHVDTLRDEAVKSLRQREKEIKALKLKLAELSNQNDTNIKKLKLENFWLRRKNKLLTKQAENLKSEDKSLSDPPCYYCGHRDRPEAFLLCSNQTCNSGRVGHFDCMGLSKLPDREDDWFCDFCPMHQPDVSMEEHICKWKKKH